MNTFFNPSKSETMVLLLWSCNRRGTTV